MIHTQKLRNFVFYCTQPFFIQAVCYLYFRGISQVQILLSSVNEPACPQDYVIFAGPFLNHVVLVTYDRDQWEAHYKNYEYVLYNITI